MLGFCYLERSRVLLFRAFRGFVIWSVPGFCYLERSGVLLFGAFQGFVIWSVPGFCYLERSRVLLFRAFQGFVIWSVPGFCYLERSRVLLSGAFQGFVIWSVPGFCYLECSIPPGTRRCCGVESTSMTLIQSRNNVVCPVGLIISFSQSTHTLYIAHVTRPDIEVYHNLLSRAPPSATRSEREHERKL